LEENASVARLAGVHFALSDLVELPQRMGDYVAIPTLCVPASNIKILIHT
jgi:hypothetical protein